MATWFIILFNLKYRKIDIVFFPAKTYLSMEVKYQYIYKQIMKQQQQSSG